jgi:hypothetical protein
VHHELQTLADPGAAARPGAAFVAERARTRTGGTMAPPIRLFLADVDGTLVTNDRVLTDRAIAVERLILP